MWWLVPYALGCPMAHPGNTPADWVSEAEIALQGRVERIRRRGGAKNRYEELTVRVRHVWKGEVGRTVTLVDRRGEGSGFARVGEEVFVHGAQTPLSLAQGVCGWRTGWRVPLGETADVGLPVTSYALERHPVDDAMEALRRCEEDRFLAAVEYQELLPPGAAARCSRAIVEAFLPRHAPELAWALAEVGKPDVVRQVIGSHPYLGPEIWAAAGHFDRRDALALPPLGLVPHAAYRVELEHWQVGLFASHGLPRRVLQELALRIIEEKPEGAGEMLGALTDVAQFREIETDSLRELLESGLVGGIDAGALLSVHHHARWRSFDTSAWFRKKAEEHRRRDVLRALEERYPAG